MSAQPQNPSPTPNIRLACIELSRFRRLAQIQVKIDKKTTILVGANNSGKTSLLIAIRNFLASGQIFGAFDINLEQWPALKALGVEWEALTEDPASAAGDLEKWNEQLIQLLACMPTIDLWFEAQAGSYNVVAPFITSLSWDGGAVGVRLRLEPASSVDELQRLAWRFREARHPVKDFEKKAHAWPADLIDYWLQSPAELGKVVVYKLDPGLGPLAKNPPAAQQDLSPKAAAVDRTKLWKLLRVDFIAAQRGLGTEEAEARSSPGTHRVGLFSTQLLKYAKTHLNVATSSQGHQPALIEAIANAQVDLDARIKDALTPSIEDVKKLGYPTLHDPQEIHFRTRIQTGDLLDHNTAVQYRLGDEQAGILLPEYSIGLGYQNLQSLSYQLVSHRESRLKPSEGSPAAVHLVLVEEPEAHLHVQVQRIFPQRATELITPTSSEHAHLSSQLIISTHASHLAHAENFDRLRYVRRIPAPSAGAMPCSDVVDLATAFGSDQDTRRFAERYFRVQHTDLLFADAAIFVEGAAERMLVPLFIQEKFPELDKRYISFLDLGGRHAHRLRPLVERLGIPTVIITDIDPVRLTKEDDKTVRKAAAIEDATQLECGNDTLNGWHPQKKQLHLMAEPVDVDHTWSNGNGGRVRFAWQVPITKGGPWPSSFEDSLVLTNLAWFQKIGTKKDKKPQAGEEPQPKVIGALATLAKAAVATPDPKALCIKLHALLREGFNKGDFSATMFERISMGAQVNCPAYIADALSWLEAELTISKKGSL